MTLSGEGATAIDTGWDGALYRTAPSALAPARFKAIPYHLWANREAGGMLVWLLEA